MKKILMTLCAGLALSSAVHATTYTFQPAVGNSGDWSNSHNWDLDDNTVPGSDDYAIIPSGKTCYVSDSAQFVDRLKVDGVLRVTADLTIVAGSTYASEINGQLQLDTSDDNYVTIYVEDEVQFVGSGSIVARRGDAGSGAARFSGCEDSQPCPKTVVFGASVGEDTLDVIGSIEFYRTAVTLYENASLIVDDADDEMVFGLAPANVLLNGDGALVVSAGTASFDYAASAASWQVLVNGGDLLLGTHTDFQDADWDITATSGTISIDSENSMSLNTLSIAGGAVDFNSALDDGNVTISLGTLQFDATCSPTGTFGISGGTVYFNDASYSSGAISVSGGTLQYNATSAPSSTFTISGGTVDVNSNLTTSGAITVSGGTLRYDAASAPSGPITISSGTVDVNAALTSSGAITVSGGSLRYDAASSPTGELLLSGGTVYVTQNVSAKKVTWSGGAFNVDQSKSIQFVP